MLPPLPQAGTRGLFHTKDLALVALARPLGDPIDKLDRQTQPAGGVVPARPLLPVVARPQNGVEPLPDCVVVGGAVELALQLVPADAAAVVQRSEERRVGKEGRSPW